MVGYSAYDWNTSAMPRSFGSAQVMSLPPISMLAFGHVDQAGNAVQQGRLAAAGRPEQHDEFAGLDVEIDDSITLLPAESESANVTNSCRAAR
jgi:hypothetical protein